MYWVGPKVYFALYPVSSYIINKCLEKKKCKKNGKYVQFSLMHFQSPVTCGLWTLWAGIYFTSLNLFSVFSKPRRLPTAQHSYKDNKIPFLWLVHTSSFDLSYICFYLLVTYLSSMQGLLSFLQSFRWMILLKAFWKCECIRQVTFAHMFANLSKNCSSFRRTCF